MRIMITLALCLNIFFIHNTASAQAPSPSSQASAGPKKQMTTIIFAGLGGAVLGLSTLSFYGRPQDNLNNIAIGFGVGIIIGTFYMTYQAASNPRSFYSETDHRHSPRSVKDFEDLRDQKRMALIEPSLVAYSFRF